MISICSTEYPGIPCQCAECWHEDTICIHHDSGSGCAACDGPVCGCDTLDESFSEDDLLCDLESLEKKL